MRGEFEASRLVCIKDCRHVFVNGALGALGWGFGPLGSGVGSLSMNSRHASNRSGL